MNGWHQSYKLFIKKLWTKPWFIINFFARPSTQPHKSMLLYSWNCGLHKSLPKHIFSHQSHRLLKHCLWMRIKTVVGSWLSVVCTRWESTGSQSQSEASILVTWSPTTNQRPVCNHGLSEGRLWSMMGRVPAPGRQVSPQGQRRNLLDGLG